MLVLAIVENRWKGKQSRQHVIATLGRLEKNLTTYEYMLNYSYNIYRK